MPSLNDGIGRVLTSSLSKTLTWAPGQWTGSAIRCLLASLGHKADLASISASTPALHPSQVAQVKCIGQGLDGAEQASAQF